MVAGLVSAIATVIRPDTGTSVSTVNPLYIQCGERCVMATETITRLVDDLEPELNLDADETVSFALDGVSYEIDLSERNAEILRNALYNFVQHARRTGGRVQRGRSAGPVVAAKDGTQEQQRAHMRELRKWARANGYTVSDRGRVPVKVVEAFENRNAQEKVIMTEKVPVKSSSNGATVTELPVGGEKPKVSRARSTSTRSKPVSGRNDT